MSSRDAYIKHAYLVEGQTMQSIGQSLGLTRERIRQLLASYGVARRPSWSYRRPPDVSRELLSQRLLAERLPVAAVARECGCSAAQVRVWAHHYGLALWRHDPLIDVLLDAAFLKAAYVEQRRSVRRIAGELGLDPRHVSRRLRELGVAVRPRSTQMERALRLAVDSLEKQRPFDRRSIRMVAIQTGWHPAAVEGALVATGLLPRCSPALVERLKVAEVRVALLVHRQSLAALARKWQVRPDVARRAIAERCLLGGQIALPIAINPEFVRTRHRAGASPQVIAEECGTSRPVIYQVLRQLGLRTQGRAAANARGRVDDSLVRA